MILTCYGFQLFTQSCPLKNKVQKWNIGIHTLRITNLSILKCLISQRYWTAICNQICSDHFQKRSIVFDIEEQSRTASKTSATTPIKPIHSSSLNPVPSPFTLPYIALTGPSPLLESPQVRLWFQGLVVLPWISVSLSPNINAYDIFVGNYKIASPLPHEQRPERSRSY